MLVVVKKALYSSTPPGLETLLLVLWSIGFTYRYSYSTLSGLEALLLVPWSIGFTYRYSYLTPVELEALLLVPWSTGCTCCYSYSTLSGFRAMNRNSTIPPRRDPVGKGIEFE